MKMAVVYHSKTGNTRQMAEEIALGMQQAGADVKVMPIEQADQEWLEQSRCIVLGTPIYMADACDEIRSWLSAELRKCHPAGKIGGAFATVDYIHGGGELGIRTILDCMMVLGMLTYSGGSSLGKPVIHLGPVGWSGNLEQTREIFRIYGQRMAEKTQELFAV